MQQMVPFAPMIRKAKRGLTPTRPARGNMLYTAECLARMLRLLREHGRDVVGQCVMEIGTGWFPTVPILLRAAGADQVITTDIVRHLDATTLAETKTFLRANKRDILSRFPEASRGIDDLLEHPDLSSMGIEYRVGNTPDLVEPQSVNIVLSRTVLEHIPEDVLPSLLQGWERLLKPNGISIHLIDHSDHFEHNDKRISRVNFLQFNQKQWAAINRIAGYQNRLRHGDYLRIVQDAGLMLLAPTTIEDTRIEDDMQVLRLASPFDRSSRQDLLTVETCLVLGPGKNLSDNFLWP